MFIQVSTSNQERNEKRFDSLEASTKRLEVQIGQVAEGQRRNEPGKLPSLPEQAKAVTVLRSGKTVPKVTVPEKSEEMPPVAESSRSQNKEKILESEEELKQQQHEKQSCTPEGKEARKRGELPLNTLHKSDSPYRLPIPFPNRLNIKKEPKRDDQYG